MSWKLTDFETILGQNILQPLGAKIDMGNGTLAVNGRFIDFVSFCPYNGDEVYQFDPLGIDDKVLDHLFASLNKEKTEALENILNIFGHLIYVEGQTLGNTEMIQHEIKTTDRPTYTKMFRYSQVHEQEIYDQIEDMLRQGIITNSNSPNNSPLWIVPKKVDYSGRRSFGLL